MIRGIIFDFNRTLYIPEIKKIPEETIELLKNLKKLGFSLALISIKEAEREEIIEAYNLFTLFSILKFVDEKNRAVFQEVLMSLKCSSEEVVVIGDRVRSEIKIANGMGIKTIWYRQGKFSNELPQEKVELPNWTIDYLPQIKDILCGGSTQ
ncbi:HAD family hydrolase [Candidatus Woesearchaeota archaeon]|nr:HAD family hydrolase [Candidatus Woesearchaeota archaeon]